MSVQGLTNWLMYDFARVIDTDGEAILAGRAICATVLAAIESGRCGGPLDVTHPAPFHRCERIVPVA